MKRYFSLGLVVLGALLIAGAPFATAQPKRVAVPRVNSEQVTRAYRQLHQAQFRVSIGSKFSISLDRQGRVIFPETVVRTIPRAGRLVREGSVVRLVLRCQCRPGHTAEPTRKPRYQVPNFNGGVLGRAYAWVRSKILVFIAHLAPLDAGNARALVGNYRIAKQSPAPGTRLRYSNRNGAWTPLTVWAHQTS